MPTYDMHLVALKSSYLKPFPLGRGGGNKAYGLLLINSQKENNQQIGNIYCNINLLSQNLREISIIFYLGIKK